MHCIKAFGLVLIGLILLVLASTPPSVQSQPLPAVRVVHSSPDAPAVDVFINGERVIIGLSFTESSPYLPAAAGAVNVRVIPTGFAPDSQSLLEQTLEIAVDQTVTVVAINSLANLDLITIVDTPPAPSEGRASVRFIHVLVDAPPVRVEDESGAVLFSDIGFGMSSGYTEVQAGVPEFSVVANDETGAVVGTTSFQLEAGTASTLIAQGSFGDETFQLVAYQDTSAASQGGQATAAPIIPDMPNTGAGGTAFESLDDGSRLWLLIGISGAVICIAGATIYLTRSSAPHSD